MRYSDNIPERTGMPNAWGNTSVITLVLDTASDQPGILTGKPGNIYGVIFKSGLKIK